MAPKVTTFTGAWVGQNVGFSAQLQKPQTVSRYSQYDVGDALGSGDGTDVVGTGEGGSEGGDVGDGVGKNVGTDEGVPVGSADG